MTTIGDGDGATTITVTNRVVPEVVPEEQIATRRDGGTRLRRCWRLAGLLVAGGTVLGVGGSTWLDTRRELRELDAMLAEVDARLPEVSGMLISDRSELDAALGDLEQARETLAKRTAERDRSRAELEATRRELDDHRDQLEGRRIELQEREASGLLLDACLLGASEALNSVAVGDLVSFARTLEKIADTCAEAGEDL